MLGSPLFLTVRATTAVGLSGAARHDGEGLLQRGEVMPVDLRDREAEADQLVGQRFERNQGLGRDVGLKSVPVDDQDQVVQTLGRRHQRRFPDGAFVELAVADHHEHPGGSAGDLRIEGDAHPHRQQVPQRSGMELDPGDRPVGVPVEVIVGRQVIRQACRREVAQLGQRSVEGGDVVPLGEKEVVARGILAAGGRGAQDVRVEIDQEVRTGERGPQEASPAGGHSDRVRAHPPGDLFDFDEIGHGVLACDAVVGSR